MYIFVCTYLYVHICMYVFIYMHACMYVYIHIHTYTYIYISVCAHFQTCLHKINSTNQGAVKKQHRNMAPIPSNWRQQKPGFLWIFS